MWNEIFTFVLQLSMVLSCRKQPHPYPAISGPRGADFIAPENTLASLDFCIRLGVDVIATDKPELLVARK